MCGMSPARARTADECVDGQAGTGELDARGLVLQHERVVRRVELCGGDYLGAREVQVLDILVQDARLETHLLVQRAHQDAVLPVHQLKHLAHCQGAGKRSIRVCSWREGRSNAAKHRRRPMRLAAGVGAQLASRRAEAARDAARCRGREARTGDARPALLRGGLEGLRHEHEALEVELEVLAVQLVGQAEALVLAAAGQRARRQTSETQSASLPAARKLAPACARPAHAPWTRMAPWRAPASPPGRQRVRAARRQAAGCE